MPNIWRATIDWTGLPGLPGYSIIYGGAGASAPDFMDDVDSWLSGTMAAICALSLKGQLNSVVDVVDSATGQTVGTESLGPFTQHNGVSATEALPLTTQVLCQWRTGVYFGGRELRGRTFVPGINTDVDDNGQVLAAVVASQNTRNAALASGGNCIVYSPTKRQYATMSTGTTWTQFASLRSRRD